MNRRRLIATYRWLFGLLTLVALVFQFSVSSQKPGFNSLNFFGFFTNLGNLFAAVVFLGGAIGPSAPTSSKLDLLRGAAVLCMALTGVVFTLLLSDVDILVLPSVNIVVHYLMPAVVVADWVVDPPQAQLAMRQGLRWLGIPLAFVVYSLVRGRFIHWYPYPFLSPDVVGYRGVFIYCACMFIGLVVLTWGIVAVGNALRRGRTPGSGR